MSTPPKVTNAKVIKSGAWYIAANLVVKGMTLITTPIFTRLLTKEEFGDYSNWMSWTHIAIIVITMKMESTLISAKFDYNSRLNQYNLSVLGLTAGLTAFWTLLINLFSSFFVDLTGVRLAYMNMMLIYCFFHAVVTFYQITERFFYRYKRSVAISLFIAISSTILSVLMVLNMQNRLTARILGGILPVIAMGAIIFLYFIKNGKKIDTAVWPYALKICIPYVPHLLSLMVLSSIDKIMITRICGSADNAMYSVAYTCGHMVTLLLVSMNSAFAPWIGDKLHEKNYSQIRKVSKYYILLFCAIAVPMMLLAPEILLLMGGHSYIEAMYVMVPVALGCVCQFLYTLFVNVEQFEKKTIGMAVASISAAVLNYILNLWLIPIYGYIAAAYTTFISYLFLLAVHMILVRLIDMQKAFSYRFVLLTVLMMTGMGLVISLSYDDLLFRYGILMATCLCVGSMGWIKRDQLMVLLHQVRKK